MSNLTVSAAVAGRLQLWPVRSLFYHEHDLIEGLLFLG